jgi:hypothetical protein
MPTTMLTEEEQIRRFKERVARVLEEYEERVQQARDRYDKKAGPEIEVSNDI